MQAWRADKKQSNLESGGGGVTILHCKNNHVTKCYSVTRTNSLKWTRTGEMTNAYNILVGKHDGKRPLGEEDNINY
jgi:hypothetical protein